MMRNVWEHLYNEQMEALANAMAELKQTNQHSRRTGAKLSSEEASSPWPHIQIKVPTATASPRTAI